jgi:hypothetical protein
MTCLRHATRLAVLILLGMGAKVSAQVDFGRDVLPILADNCFLCHGPSDTDRQAGLRLDTKEGAFRQKRNRTMIVPGHSGQSEVIRRIVSTNPDEVMPPPDSQRKLTPKQIEVLRKWVDEGAKWGMHWAYSPITNPTPPAVTLDSWPRNPIDQFILNRLEKEGLKPSPDAPRETWLRRVTLDLTGLPPTVDEIEAFLNDESPAAYETVVDRLLQSPRYGERMAVDWLDIARFADTHGYQMDRARPMWPYRDWVISAFNRNQPFNEFVTWQLAGDLLPGATKEQRLATAFNRLHMQNEEGGIVEEEFRVAYVVDRVNTFGTAFLGQTLECARCHDHKYDPLTLKDYYQLFAFFQNIDESGQTTHFTDAMPVPTLLLTTDEQDQQLAQLQARIMEREQALIAAKANAGPAFEKWLSKRTADLEITGLVAAFDFDEFVDNHSPNAVDPKQPAKGHDGPQLVPGKRGQAVKLNGENGFTFPGIGHFTRTDAFSISLWLNTPTYATRAVVLHHSKAPIDAGSRGYEILLENGRVAVGLHHMWPGNSLKVVTKQVIPVDVWSHIVVSYDGSSRAAGVKIYINGVSAELDVVRDGLWKDITYGGGKPDLTLGYRFRDNGFKGGKVDELRVYNRALTAVEAAYLAGKEIPIDQNVLFDHFFATEYEPAQKLVAELQAVRREQSQFINPIPEAMVMQELPTPKPAFLLQRGAYDAPGEQVYAETPSALPKFPANAPRNRLGLAQWLTAPDNPLFARVTVNRLWQQMFGRGLVETSDNFGTTGSPPSHPELLDWLASDLMRDWDIKRALKQIALSATYRQASTTTSQLMAQDPYNNLLARFPVRRLTTEMLRDQALAVSGLLVEKLGGPSVYPYQPEGIWNEAMGRPQYPRSKGPDLYRRSLYTFWKRTAPPPAMVTFDAADRSNCSARRQETNTPLQALVLLNDTTYVEAARLLGQRVLTEGGTTPAQRAAWAFRTVAGRKPTEKETAILTKLYEEQRADFANNPTAADKLLTVGDKQADPALDKSDLAAATILGLAVLNHDEAINRR